MSDLNPPPPPENRGGLGVLIVIGSVISVLLVILIVMLLTRSSGESRVNPGSTTIAASTGTAAGTDESTPSSTPLPTATEPAFTLQPGDILISASEGVRIARGAEVVGRAVVEPTENALATPDGQVVYQTPPEFVYPDYWPGNEPVGEPKVRMVAPDGTTSLLYVGGASIRLFDVAVIPSVSVAPSVIGLRFDSLADGTLLNSLIIVPIDGSEFQVVSDLPPRVTGAAWLGEFFAVAVTEESGDSYIAAFGLDGQEVVWPLNPEPVVGRDASSRVTTLARIGDTTLIAYTLASGGFWEGVIDLVIYDTASGETVATIDVGVSRMIVSALHSSNDALVVSKIWDSQDGSGWGFIHVPPTVISTATWETSLTGVSGGGTYSIVDGTSAEVVSTATTGPPVVLPDSALIYNRPVDDAIALLTSVGLAVELNGIGCSNSTQPGMVRRVTVGSEQNVGIIYGKPSDTFDAGALASLSSGSTVTVWTPTANPCP